MCIFDIGPYRTIGIFQQRIGLCELELDGQCGHVVDGQTLHQLTWHYHALSIYILKGFTPTNAGFLLSTTA